MRRTGADCIEPRRLAGDVGEGNVRARRLAFARKLRELGAVLLVVRENDPDGLGRSQIVFWR
ncbi:hypothetical protein ASG43_02045 [Aureimonas sp. Leaf454]|nr:hypothetical protein ASG43_02045 [Aureimonas sp. Leaf454]